MVLLLRHYNWNMTFKVFEGSKVKIPPIAGSHKQTAIATFHFFLFSCSPTSSEPDLHLRWATLKKWVGRNRNGSNWREKLFSGSQRRWKNERIAEKDETVEKTSEYFVLVLSIAQRIQQISDPELSSMLGNNLQVTQWILFVTWKGIELPLKFRWLPFRIRMTEVALYRSNTMLPPHLVGLIRHYPVATCDYPSNRVFKMYSTSVAPHNLLKSSSSAK